MTIALIFVDCEATGTCPANGLLTEFGAVAYLSRETFHGVLWHTTPSRENPAIPILVNPASPMAETFLEFEKWLKEVCGGERPVMISDNPAYDFMWIADGFASIGRNPLGHSARRIGDFYAGLVGNFHRANEWKRLRVTRHDHNPVNDALGNLEAFDRILHGER